MSGGGAGLHFGGVLLFKWAPLPGVNVVEGVQRGRSRHARRADLAEAAQCRAVLLFGVKAVRCAGGGFSSIGRRNDSEQRVLLF